MHVGKRVQIDGAFDHLENAKLPVTFATDLVQIEKVPLCALCPERARPSKSSDRSPASEGAPAPPGSKPSSSSGTEQKPTDLLPPPNVSEADVKQFAQLVRRTIKTINRRPGPGSR